MNGDDGDDVFWGWGGVFVDDTLAGGAGSDRIQNPGTAGPVTLAGFSPLGGIEQIAAATGAGTQYVAGTAAAEVFDFTGVALTGITYVDAGDGADRVLAAATPGIEYRGGAGDDTLESGAGADKLTGGAGNDLFRMAAAGGEDRVTDFKKGQDKLDLRPLMLTTSQVSWARSGADTLVTVQAPAGAFVVRLVAYTGTLDLTDFLFV